MSITGWALVLGAGGTAGFFVRRRWKKKRNEAKKDQERRKSRADQAELDRIACRDLGQSLMSSSPSGRTEPDGKPAASVAGKSG